MLPPNKLPDQSWRAVVEMAQPAEVEAYLVNEIFKAMGVRAESYWRSVLKPFFTQIVRGFAQQAAAFDLSVAQRGLYQSAQEWLGKWVPGLQISGEEQLPPNQPVIIAANHPGTFDSLAIASAIARPDLKIIAAGNPFFRTLPNVRNYLIYATRDIQVRMTTLRRGLRHLQTGGALLIFPFGKIEPDPLHFRDSARQTLGRWSESLELFLRKAPEARLVVAINSGFVAPEYLRNPLVRFQSSDENKQILAEFIQVIQQVVFNRRISNWPRLQFSEPAYFPGNLTRGDIQAQIIAIASRLLDTDQNTPTY